MGLVFFASVDGNDFWSFVYIPHDYWHIQLSGNLSASIGCILNSSSEPQESSAKKAAKGKKKTNWNKDLGSWAYAESGMAAQKAERRLFFVALFDWSHRFLAAVL